MRKKKQQGRKKSLNYSCPMTIGLSTRRPLSGRGIWSPVEQGWGVAASIVTTPPLAEMPRCALVLLRGAILHSLFFPAVLALAAFSLLIP